MTIKKLIAALLGSLCVLLTPNVEAQTLAHPTNLKGITVVSMLDYGQALFERRNYKGSIPVFQRVLDYDPCNSTARSFLKQIVTIGFKADIRPMPNCAPQLAPKEVKPKVAAVPSKQTLQQPIFTIPEQKDNGFIISESYIGRSHFTRSTPKADNTTTLVSHEQTHAANDMEYTPTADTTSTSTGAIDDLAQLQNDLRAMRLSLQEQASKLNDLEQQLP
jgi:hypothetical protein